MYLLEFQNNDFVLIKSSKIYNRTELMYGSKNTTNQIRKSKKKQFTVIELQKHNSTIHNISDNLDTSIGLK